MWLPKSFWHLHPNWRSFFIIVATHSTQQGHDSSKSGDMLIGCHNLELPIWIGASLNVIPSIVHPKVSRQHSTTQIWALEHTYLPILTSRVP